MEPSATIVNVCSSSRPLFLALSRLTDGLHKNEKGLHFNSRPENWPAPLCGLHCGNRGEVFVRRPSSCSSTNAIFFFFLHQNRFFFPLWGGCTAIRSQVIASEEVSPWLGPLKQFIFPPASIDSRPTVCIEEDKSFEKGGTIFKEDKKKGEGC